MAICNFLAIFDIETLSARYLENYLSYFIFGTQIGDEV